MADTLIAFPQAGVSGGQVVPIKAKDNGDGSYSIAVNGNAQVPASAPIQPPQAFVDNSAKFFTAIANGTTSLDISNTNTSFVEPGASAEVFGVWGFCAVASALGSPVMNFSGNKITNTDAILAACVASNVPNGTLDLSGGTNAAPTGQGITDKAALILAGWTVTTN